MNGENKKEKKEKQFKRRRDKTRQDNLSKKNGKRLPKEWNEENEIKIKSKSKSNNVIMKRAATSNFDRNKKQKANI